MRVLISSVIGLLSIISVVDPTWATWRQVNGVNKSQLKDACGSSGGTFQSNCVMGKGYCCDNLDTGANVSCKDKNHCYTWTSRTTGQPEKRPGPPPRSVISR
jgi:hypothetical protein